MAEETTLTIARERADGPGISPGPFMRRSSPQEARHGGADNGQGEQDEYGLPGGVKYLQRQDNSGEPVRKDVQGTSQAHHTTLRTTTNHGPVLAAPALQRNGQPAVILSGWAAH
jgi:hypothetical protein